MNEIIIAQDNRLTTSRYELSLIEKRVFYFIIKEVRGKHLNGTVQRDLFDDMNLKINLSDLTKEINGRENNIETKKALKSLRKRSFEWDNGLDEDHKDYEWFEVGFINYSEIKNGVAEVQVSKKLMPFLVELSGHFTAYSLNVAMSLKSKWSQRMYELCQKWQGTDGFRISVEDLRKTFVLEGKYSRYALFNERVLQVAKRELKALYDIGQCDVYFEFTEERSGRSVEMLRFKLFRKNTMNVKTTHDMLLELIPVFQKLFNTSKMPKNDVYIKSVIEHLQRYPNLIEPLNTRIKEILANGVKEDTQRYVRFILNEDVLSYVENPARQKKVSKNEEKQPNDVMADILGLANTKKV
jgi:plasmid replication initiation protein